MCDLINLGSLTCQFPDLSKSPLDDVEQLNLTGALDVLSSISKLIIVSDTGPKLKLADIRAELMDRTLHQGETQLIMPSPSISKGWWKSKFCTGKKRVPPPPQPTQALSEFLERINQRHESPQFKIIMRLTAIPNNTNFCQDVAIPSQTRSDKVYSYQSI